MTVNKANIISSPLAGAVPLNNFWDRLGLGKIIRNGIGERPTQSYQWDDLAKAWYLTTGTKGTRLINVEDAKYDLKVLKNFEFPSHDTCGRGLKSLATENRITQYKNSRGKEITNVLNSNQKLVDLNITIMKELGQLEELVPYTLDVDATGIPSKTKEAVVAYKNGTGYMPMLSSIKKYPTTSINRSGNTSPFYGIVDFLKETLAILDHNNIFIDRIRMDTAGYQKVTTRYIDDIGKKFLTGVRNSRTTFKALREDCIWTKGIYKSKNSRPFEAEYSERKFSFDDDNKVYREVAVRIKESVRNAVSTDTYWDLNEGHYYKVIITNDWEASPKDLLYEYNERGDAENVFKRLKSSLGVRILPFSKLNENHVFIIMQMILHNVFEKYIGYASSIEKRIKVGTTLKTLRKRFMSGTVYLIDGIFSFESGCRIDFEKLA